MLQRKTPLIIKISSSLSTAIFDCKIISDVCNLMQILTYNDSVKD